MKDDEINRAIAEACGWRKEDGVYMWEANGIDCTYPELWDWCNDLNAMHEAEKTLLTNTKERGPYSFTWKKYLSELFQIILDDQKKNNSQRMTEMIVPKWIPHATARQRAEAFLRTIGRWKE